MGLRELRASVYREDRVYFVRRLWVGHYCQEMSSLVPLVLMSVATQTTGAGGDIMSSINIRSDAFPSLVPSPRVLRQVLNAIRPPDIPADSSWHCPLDAYSTRPG